MNNNRATVWVTSADSRKDLSDAERYGDLKDVFSTTPRSISPDKLIAHAREVLDRWRDGDSLLAIGDPMITAICVTVLSEYTDNIPLLRWDRNSFRYSPTVLNFNHTV